MTENPCITSAPDEKVVRISRNGKKHRLQQLKKRLPEIFYKRMVYFVYQSLSFQLQGYHQALSAYEILSLLDTKGIFLKASHHFCKIFSFRKLLVYFLHSSGANRSIVRALVFRLF